MEGYTSSTATVTIGGLNAVTNFAVFINTAVTCTEYARQEVMKGHQ